MGNLDGGEKSGGEGEESGGERIAEGDIEIGIGAGVPDDNEFGIGERLGGFDCLS